MDVRLPQLGEGADSGSVVGLFVKEGDEIKKGQTIIELENEKAVAPIPSPADGRVTQIRVKEGDTISVGQVILSVAAPGESTAAPAQEQPAAAPPSARESAEPAEPEEGRAPEPEPETEGGPPEPRPATPAGFPPPAAPSIRKLARDLGIDLGRVKGSERGGRIVLADLRTYIERLQQSAFPKKEAKPSQPVPEPIDFSKWGPIHKKPLSQLRRTIGRRMHESWSAIPHVTQFDEADVTPLLELRKKYNPEYEKQGAKLTLTSFALKAAVSTLRKHPIFNASLDEQAGELVLKDYYHLGLAVDTEAGLIVPVIRDVDKKSLLDLSKEVNALAEKARDRKISLEELKGGTFTITNQGGLGGAHFTPIINHPEAAILGLGRGRLKPVVRDGKIESRTLLPLALSYDHRLIDGGQAARFITDLVHELEHFQEASLRLG